MGFFVFAVGLIAAIIGAAKPSPGIGEWPDTSYIFWIGAMVAVVGCYLWRKEIKTKSQAAASGSDKESGNQETAMSLLKAFQTRIDEFQGTYQNWDVKKLFDEADSFHDQFVNPIVERRYDLIHSFGMAKGAEIILEFSKGERYFNRMHTAALDGHIGEAHASWPKAYQAFSTAISRL